MRARFAAAIGLPVTYLLFFGSVGVSLPFLPGYLQHAGLSPSQIGLLLAVGPAFALVAPPLWGQVADRSGRPGLVLGFISLGAALGYGLMLVSSAFTWLLLAFAVHAAFGSAITSVLDAVALRQVATTGGAYAHFRSYGSLGFVLASVAFGFSVTKVDEAAVLAPLGLLLLMSPVAFGLLTRRGPVDEVGPRPSLAAAAALLQTKGTAWLLVAAMLHWIACAPYHATLALHVEALGLSPRVVSLSAGLGVLSEIAVLVTYPRWSHRVSPNTLLLWSFGLSALRWWGMAATSDARVLVPLAILHGFTFGAFFVAGVMSMAQVAPVTLRATAQALFVASAFGLGGIIGFIGTGAAYQALGGHTLFAIAGVLELLPAIAIALRGRGAAGTGRVAASQP